MIALPVIVPDGFSPVVVVGDTVSVGHLLGKKTGSNEEIINIAEHLSLPVKKAKRVLLKSPGDTVSEGDVLAVKKSFWGFEKESLVSHVSGTVVRFERDTGNLIIQTSYNVLTEDLLSPVDGIVAVCDNKQIVINTQKHTVASTASVGESARGEVFILEDSFADVIDDAGLLFTLTSDAIDKIIVGKRFTREVLAKGIGMGAIGAVGVTIDQADIAYLSSKFPRVPVFTVSEDVAEQLKAWGGKSVYLDALAQAIVFLQL